MTNLYSPLWARRARTSTALLYNHCRIMSENSVKYVPLFAFRFYKISFPPGIRRGLRWGSLRRSTRPRSRLGRGYPPPIPMPYMLSVYLSRRLCRQGSMLSAPSVPILFTVGTGNWALRYGTCKQCSEQEPNLGVFRTWDCSASTGPTNFGVRAFSEAIF